MNYNQDLYSYRTLRVYLYYRLVLASLLYAMFEAEITSQAVGQSDPRLFQLSTLFYAFASLASFFLLLDKNSHRSTAKVITLLLTDVVVLLCLIHASGGITSGLGYLLIITSAIASMFLKQRIALAFAALITILIILQSIVQHFDKGLVKPVFSAGTLGFLIFITATTFQYLAEKVRISSLEAAQKSEYAKQLVQLAQHIVTRMRTGIVVIDDKDQIELVNDSAAQLLGLPRDGSLLGENIAQRSNLGNIIENWRKNPVSGTAFVHAINESDEARISFATLNTPIRELTILYIEDYRTLVQQAQQLKLASLGRLTASIAHEIRNPLGAISHAAQLLSESEFADKSDKRFTEIILQHSQRVNEIIETTMSLSKRKEPKAQLIDLKEWIPEFIEEYKTLKPCDIDYRWDEDQPNIKMDPAHLRQILANLFDNGLRYSIEATGIARIRVLSQASQNDDTTQVEVIDYGPGVPADKVEDIFEPFFTTGHQGSGLGLYISRELCEINQATLIYQRTSDNKSCFKINFPHHQRMI